MLCNTHMVSNQCGIHFDLSKNIATQSIHSKTISGDVKVTSSSILQLDDAVM